MSRFAGIVQRLRETLLGGREERELQEEIETHISMDIARRVADGTDPDEARRLATRAFGSTLHVKEQVRSERGFRWLEQVVLDLRYAARRLRRSPGFTGAVVLTLALGIGATTTVFTVVDHVVIRALPFPDSDRLVQVVQQNSPTNRWALSVADVLGIEEMGTTFESFAVLRRGTAALTGQGRPEQIRVGHVTADWFDLLGVDFASGRAFLEEEADLGGPDLVVLSRRFANQLFGAGVDGAGEQVILDGRPYTVVGVLAEEWRSLAGFEAQAWPLMRLDTPPRRGPFGLRGIGRLRPGATLETARADLDRVSERLFPRWADGFRDETARLTPYPLRDFIVGSLGNTLWFVMGAVIGVLLIAVANVANLFLARTTSRTSEMALRASLGATRFQLGRQLLTEGLLVATLGGLAAIAVAKGGLALLTTLAPSLPRANEITLDGRILAISASVTLVAAVLFAMAPLLQVASGKMGSMLGLREAIGGRTQAAGRLRAALVAAEFALAFPLLSAAVLLTGSLGALQRVDPGYDPADLFVASVSLPQETYPGYQETQAFWFEALRLLNEQPNIALAGMGTLMPPRSAGDTNNFDLVANPVEPGTAEPVSSWAHVSPEFFSVLGVPLIAGRMFEPSDDGGEGRSVAIVSRSWARKFSDEASVIGTQFYNGGDRSQATTIIGVVGDLKLEGLESTDDAAAYEPLTQSSWRQKYLVVRPRGDGGDALEQVREVIGGMDPSLPLANTESMEERMSRAVAQPRLWAVLVGLFSALGLVLSAIGAYGVLSYYVLRQSRDLGIRVALGANPSSLRRLVLGRGLGLAAVGVAIGILASLGSARWIRSIVFGVSATSPWVLTGVGAMLLTVAILACWIPARRATQVDPMVALRAE